MVLKIYTNCDWFLIKSLSNLDAIFIDFNIYSTNIISIYNDIPNAKVKLTYGKWSSIDILELRNIFNSYNNNTNYHSVQVIDNDTFKVDNDNSILTKSFIIDTPLHKYFNFMYKDN